MRRSKGCDCCGEKPQPQETPSTELMNIEYYDVKVTETKMRDVQTPVTISETSKTNLYSEINLLSEHHSVNFHLGLKEENDTNDSFIVSETELKENTQNSLPSEIVNFKAETFDRDSEEGVSIKSQEPANKKCKTVGPCLDDSKDISLECSTLETKEEKSEAVPVKEVITGNIVNVEADACKVKDCTPEVEAMELDVEHVKSEASVSEQESAKTSIFEEAVTEENSDRSDESEANKAEVLNAKEAITEEFSLAIGQADSATPVKIRAQNEISVAGPHGENDGSDAGSSEMNAEVENCEERVIGEVNADIDHVNEIEDRDLTTEACKPEEATTNRTDSAIDSFAPDTLEMSTEEGKVTSNKAEPNIVLSKPEEAKLDDNQMTMGNDAEILQKVHCTPEKVEEASQSLTSEVAVSELIAEDNNASPQKLSEFNPLLLSANDSPSGMQTRCVWSPLTSPSSSILKRGLKRPQEDEISSPVNKVGV